MYIQLQDFSLYDSNHFLTFYTFSFFFFNFYAYMVMYINIIISYLYWKIMWDLY